MHWFDNWYASGLKYCSKHQKRGNASILLQNGAVLLIDSTFLLIDFSSGENKDVYWSSQLNIVLSNEYFESRDTAIKHYPTDSTVEINLALLCSGLPSTMARPTATTDVNAYDTPNPPKLPGQDDSSVATEPRDNLPSETQRKTIEFFLRIEHSANVDDKNANIPVMKLHCKFLLAIWGAFTPEIIMYEKKNKHVTQHVLSNITIVSPE
jgi:hypothetical protein